MQRSPGIKCVWECLWSSGESGNTLIPDFCTFLQERKLGFFVKQVKLEKRVSHAVWTLYAESHMQSFNTDVWWGGRQSEEHTCAKKKKKINENQTHGWFCFWSPVQRQWDSLAWNQLFLSAWRENCRLFRCKQTQRIPEGSSSEGDYRRSTDHTTMGGFELLKDAQAGDRADTASPSKILKKIAFIEDSVAYTLIYGKGTQK